MQNFLLEWCADRSLQLYHPYDDEMIYQMVVSCMWLNYIFCEGGRYHHMYILIVVSVKPSWLHIIISKASSLALFL